MARCDDCKANKVCDHNRFGFENCGNFIPTDVVPKSEVDSEIKVWQELYADTVSKWEKAYEELEIKLETAKAEVAREIFEEIEGSIAVHAFTGKSEDYADGMYDAIEWVDSKIAELKKKYMEDNDEISVKRVKRKN